MWMLCPSPLASTRRCRFVDDTVVQAQRDDAIVAQLPEPSLGVPGSPGLLHPIADAHLGKGDAQPDDLIGGDGRAGRLPIPLGDKKLHGLESLLPLGIVAIAHADEAVTVLRQQPLRSLLARLEAQPDPSGRKLARAPRRQGMAGEAGGSGQRATV